MKKTYLVRAEALVTAVNLFFATVRLNSVPPLWWDEGWTLSIARNWLETGHYKRLLNGHLVSHGLEAAPMLTGSIYLAFKIFGVGVFEARMVGVLFTLATLLVIYYLARRLYDRKIALTTLLILTFAPAYIELIPVYVGRQVLGEMPAMFFLSFGYAAFLLLLPRHFFWMSMPVLFWTVALGTKAQVLPFWLCSMICPLGVLLCKRAWRLSLRFGFACAGSLIGSQLLLVLWQRFLWPDSPNGAVTGLYEVTAAVTSIPARMFALIVLVLFGLPTLAGLCHAAWSMRARKSSFLNPVECVRLSLLILSGSWFAWFVTLSVGWIRYIFPATFIGSIFLAAMMHDFTRGFDISYTIERSFGIFRRGGLNKQALGVLFVAAIIMTSVPRTAIALYKTYVLDADISVKEAAAFLNSQTPSGALIETYDSELFFLLQRPYHYPPDQIHVELIRRTFLYDDNTIIHYDPLATNPDYLVVGPQSKKWQLYDSVLGTRQFRLIRAYKRYDIYERVR
jgi:4-amino-4-deoxy-L-arabinose transferase-like glycosyltransferase